MMHESRTVIKAISSPKWLRKHQPKWIIFRVIHKNQGKQAALTPTSYPPPPRPAHAGGKRGAGEDGAPPLRSGRRSALPPALGVVCERAGRGIERGGGVGKRRVFERKRLPTE